MGRHILGVATCLSFLVSGHAFFYEDCRNRLESRLPNMPHLWASVLSSLIVTVVGVGSVGAIGWLVWRVLGWGRTAVKGSSLAEVNNVLEPIEVVERELAREVHRDQRRQGNLQGRRSHLQQLWQMLSDNTSLSRDDERLTRLSERRSDFRCARELRRVVAEGFGRMNELLSDETLDHREAIVRCYETVVDLRTKHIPHFKTTVENL